jgi:hypothetical protein
VQLSKNTQKIKNKKNNKKSKFPHPFQRVPISILKCAKGQNSEGTLSVFGFKGALCRPVDSFHYTQLRRALHLLFSPLVQDRFTFLGDRAIDLFQ